MVMIPEEDLAAAVEKFMANVDVLPFGCWAWVGPRSRGKGNRKWYGSFRWRGKVWRAHSFSCSVLAGKHCPPGHHRDHTCNFSLCVNPEHIEVVTHAENQRRKVNREAARKDAARYFLRLVSN